MRHPTIHPLLLSGIEGGWLRETEAFPGDFYVSRLGDPVLTKIRVSVRSLHQQYRHHLGTCWKCGLAPHPLGEGVSSPAGAYASPA